MNLYTADSGLTDTCFKVVDSRSSCNLHCRSFDQALVRPCYTTSDVVLEMCSTSVIMAVVLKERGGMGQGRGAGSCSFLTEEVLGAQNFNYAFKFPLNGGLFAPFFEASVPTR